MPPLVNRCGAGGYIYEYFIYVSLVMAIFTWPAEKDRKQLPRLKATGMLQIARKRGRAHAIEVSFSRSPRLESAGAAKSPAP
jgi:hypothetical protein